MNPIEDPTDSELASRAAAGDKPAFTLLMQRHKSWVHRFCLRYVSEADAAFDVTQETFVSAWRSIDRFDNSRPWTTWLRAIALNKCRDRGRREVVRRAIRGVLGAEAEETLAHADPSPNPEEQLVEVESTRQISQAIARLPERLKEPLILTCFDGLSHAEAASLLGVTPKTIETRVYRARRKLAEQLRLRE